MYKKKAHIHFMGIGGIGMSGIATILRHQGYEISGCDIDTNQASIKALETLGCKIGQGNNGPLCHNNAIEILVYSSAIQPENPEIRTALSRRIPIIPRALMLAELMRTKYSIAIAGAHGKTTTTSLISHILIEAKYDPTVIIGGLLKNISHNARLGEGDFLVAEADESDRSFLHLHPTIAVITNIDNEHLDTYTDLNDIKKTFALFLNNIPFYGKAIVCVDDPHIQSLLPIPHIKTVTYGLEQTKTDISAVNIELNPESSTFQIANQGNIIPGIHMHLAMPGKHNILNALAAIAVARDLEIPLETIQHALTTFGGVERRFTLRGTYHGALIFDDYGHHPTEIYHTLKMARLRTTGKLIVIFQPHRYTRTMNLWQEFVSVFSKSDIDALIITDIYAASEQPIADITGAQLALAIKTTSPAFSVTHACSDNQWQTVINEVNQLVSPGDLVLAQGAGSIYRLYQHLHQFKPLL